MTERDRWERKDWWGVVLDAPDVGVLARFYSQLRGWAIRREDEIDAACLAIRRNDAYVRPTWPAEPGQPQMMMHLDFEVEDLAAETQRAIELGAELAAYQPQENVRILLDPAGHPFCLYT